MKEIDVKPTGQNLNANTALNYLEQKRKELSQLKKAAVTNVAFMDSPDATAFLSDIGKAIEHRDKARNELYSNPDFKNKASALRTKLANNPSELQQQMRSLEKSDKGLAGAIQELKTAAENYSKKEIEFRSNLSALQNKIRSEVLPNKEKEFKNNVEEFSPLFAAPLEKLKNAYREATQVMRPFTENTREKRPIGITLLSNAARLQGFPDQKDCRTAFTNSLLKLKKEMSMKTAPTTYEKSILNTTDTVLKNIEKAHNIYKNDCLQFGENGAERLENVLSDPAEKTGIFSLPTTQNKTDVPKEHLENKYVIRAKQYLERREVLKKNTPIKSNVLSAI